MEMRCHYSILLVCNILLLVVFLGYAVAEEEQPPPPPDTPAVRLADMVVTATRSDLPEQDVATHITVITREDIAAMSAATAADVLQFVPGVYVESGGGIGSQATVRIQGSETRHVAVYQDGVPLNLQVNPMTDFSFIPVGAIDRIEVYQGAASSAWGSSLGGVINIITREPDTQEPLSTEVQASYGEAETFRGRAEILGTADRCGYFVSLAMDESDGFVDFSRYDQTAVYAKINYAAGDTSRLNLACSFDDGHREDPVIGYPDFWDDMNQSRSYQRLLLETFPADTLSLVLEARHHEFDALIEDVYADHRETYNDYQEESWGASARVTYTPTTSHTLNLGVDGDWGWYQWHNYARDYDTGNWAAYINDTLRWQRISVNAGLRYDDNRYFGSQVSPSAGVVYRLWNDRALVRAQVARGFSAPPPAWLNDPFGGNPGLEPETAVNYQLGAELQALSWLRFEINGFYSHVRNLIQPDMVRLQYVNIDQVIRRGVTGGVVLKAGPGLRLSAFGTFTDVEDRRTGETLPDIPRVQYQVAAVHTWQWLTQTLHGDYTDHNSSYPETRDQVFVFDYLIKARLPLAEKFGRPELFGAVHNLFDVRKPGTRCLCSTT